LRRLDNFDGPAVAEKAIEYNLFEEAFEIFKKFNRWAALLGPAWGAAGAAWGGAGARCRCSRLAAAAKAAHASPARRR
jgi:hypothetical protein